MKLSDTEWFIVRVALRQASERHPKSSNDFEKLLYQIEVNRMEREGSSFMPEYDLEHEVRV